MKREFKKDKDMQMGSSSLSGVEVKMRSRSEALIKKPGRIL